MGVSAPQQLRLTPTASPCNFMMETSAAPQALHWRLRPHHPDPCASSVLCPMLLYSVDFNAGPAYLNVLCAYTYPGVYGRSFVSATDPSNSAFDTSFIV